MRFVPRSEPKELMKNIVIASLIAALGGLAAAPQASAKNEGLAALGGFIGGVVVGASINDRDHDHRSDYRSDYRPDYRPNYYSAPAPVVCEPPRYAPPVPRGYWREVPVRS